MGGEHDGPQVAVERRARRGQAFAGEKDRECLRLVVRLLAAQPRERARRFVAERGDVFPILHDEGLEPLAELRVVKARRRRGTEVGAAHRHAELDRVGVAAHRLPHPFSCLVEAGRGAVEHECLTPRGEALRDARQHRQWELVPSVAPMEEHDALDACGQLEVRRMAGDHVELLSLHRLEQVALADVEVDAVERGVGPCEGDAAVAQIRRHDLRPAKRRHHTDRGRARTQVEHPLARNVGGEKAGQLLGAWPDRHHHRGRLAQHIGEDEGAFQGSHLVRRHDVIWLVGGDDDAEPDEALGQCVAQSDSGHRHLLVERHRQGEQPVLGIEP